MAEIPDRRTERLNPFAFPSDTTFRFGLLIVLVVGASIFAADWFHTIALGERVVTNLAECFDLANRQVPEAERFQDTLERQRVIDECRSGLERERGWFLLAGAGTVAVAACAVFLVTPAIKMRRRNLVPIGVEDAPGILERVAELANEAGLAGVPEAVWNPSRLSADALVFGRPGSYKMVLGAALIVAPRPMFDAVVRHELSHIKNRDVVLTYLANSIWYTFVAVGVIPYALTRFMEGALNPPVVLRFAAITGLVYLTRAALLRSREYYADVRASVWDGPSGQLRAVVSTLKAKLRGVGALVSVHPEPKNRLEVIEDPGLLLRLSVHDAFGSATAATIAVATFATVYGTFATGTGATTLSQTAGSFVVSPFLGCAVAVGLWRADFRSRITGSKAQATWPVALALALGFLLGDWLSLERAIEGGALLGSHNERVAAVMVVITLALTLAWLRSASELWIEAAPGRRPAELYAPLLLWSAAIFVWMLGLLYSLLFYARGFAGGEPPNQAGDGGLGGVEGAFAVFGLLAGYVTSLKTTLAVASVLGLFPLIALRKRKNGSRCIPDWAWLDPPEEPRIWSEDRHQSGPALKLGLIAGLLFGTWLVLGRLLLRAVASEEMRESTALVLQLAAGMTWLAILVECGVAFVVARRSERGSVVLGLSAALLAGLVASLLTALINLGFGGSTDWDQLSFVLVKFLSSGLFWGLVAAAIGSFSRRNRSPTASQVKLSGVMTLLKFGIPTVLVVPVFAFAILARSQAPSAVVTAELQEYVREVGIPLAQFSQEILTELNPNLQQVDPLAEAALEGAISQHVTLVDQAEQVEPLTSEVRNLHESLVSILSARTAELEELRGRVIAGPIDASVSQSTSRLSAWIEELKSLMVKQGLPVPE